jgi:WD40-like Beta Propeller Repeat
MQPSARALMIAAAFWSTGVFGESRFSAWGPAVNLALDQGVLHCGGINTASNEAGPAITRAGLSLYFSSNRSGGEGDNDLYLVRRPSIDAPWGPASNLGKELNTAAIESIPSFSRDGHWLFFNSNRGPLCTNPAAVPPYCGQGDLDIWASYRSRVHDEFAWEKPVNLGPGVNSPKFEAGAGYFENEDGKPLLYFGRGDAGFPPSQTNPTVDIWVSELQPDGTFGNARLVPGVNSPAGDQRPSVRFDGLEMFFFSNRIGSVPMPPPNSTTASTDIWVTTRPNAEDPWGEPVRLMNEADPASQIDSRVNTEAGDFNPQISPDGLTLYFASSRAGGCGGFDLYMMTRTRLHGQKEDPDR